MAVKGIAGPPIQHIRPVTAAGKAGKTQTSFGDVLKNRLREVNDLQNKADKSIEDLTTGRSANIHETMIAMEKADVSFKLMMQVRSKIMTAYKEIIKTPV